MCAPLYRKGWSIGRSLPRSRGSPSTRRGIPIAMVADSSNKVEQRTLKIDRAIGDRWLVSEGLNQGDRLIVEGIPENKTG